MPSGTPIRRELPQIPENQTLQMAVSVELFPEDDAQVLGGLIAVAIRDELGERQGAVSMIKVHDLPVEWVATVLAPHEHRSMNIRMPDADVDLP